MALVPFVAVRFGYRRFNFLRRHLAGAATAHAVAGVPGQSNGHAPAASALARFPIRVCTRRCDNPILPVRRGTGASRRLREASRAGG